MNGRLLLLYFTNYFTFEPCLGAFQALPNSNYAARSSSWDTYKKIDWMKSTYEPSCSQSKQVVKLIYFWPGDRVDLQCKVCEKGLDSNGLVKYWGFADHPQRFLEKPQAHITSDYLWTPLFADTTGDRKNATYYAPFSTNFNLQPHEIPTLPREQLIQENGKLIILNTNLGSAGVYFCMDEMGKAETRYFYLLAAMAPMLRMTDTENHASAKPEFHKCVDAGQADKDDVPGLMYPDYLWRFNFLPLAVLPTPKICERKGNTICLENKGNDAHVTSEMVAAEESIPLRLKHVAKDDAIAATNIRIKIEWSSWTKCTEEHRMQTREGHCVVFRNHGTRADPQYSEEMEWIRKLDSLLDSLPDESQTVRIHSTLLYSLITNGPVKGHCATSKTLHYHYLATVLASFDFDFVFDRPLIQGKWRACIGDSRIMKERLFKNLRTSDFVGTYAIQNRPCQPE